jgi:succinyldiaminopimelate transaminase
VRSVHVSPILASQSTYPFVRLERAKREARAAGIEIVDFGTGDPREPTDSRIRQALVDGLEERMGYPRAEGLPELREAIAGWAARRFGVSLDPDREVIPTLGSKEAIFSFAQAVLDEDGPKDAVVVTEPGYPVQERGALFARAHLWKLPLREDHGFLPDLDALEDDAWRRVAIFWVNYPNNPTGAVAPLGFFERLVELAEEHDFLVASDEAYSELWFDEPPPSALQAARSRVVAFNSLSKRSSMTGYRSGFVAGPPDVIAALKEFRPTVGTAPQEFVQRAAVVAWSDEAHVERARESYRRKRDLVLPAFERSGFRLAAGSRATMYLWLEVPGRESSEACAERLLRRGIVVAPGAYLGDVGEGYVRVALVPTEEECAVAAEILEEAR